MTINPGELAEAHWRSLELLLPGRGVGVYLLGSAALGDLQPRSDVDTLTVIDRELDLVEQQLLRGVHADLVEAFPDTRYDTVYVPQAWLAEPPAVDTVAIAPHSLDGRLRLGEPSGEIQPVTWLMLAEHGVRVAGPDVDELGLHTDREAARAYVRGNLQGYWAGVGGDLALATQGMDQWADLHEPDVVVWTVLGAPRLAAFLDTGALISKTQAADYLAEQHPEHAALARRCAAHRRGEPQVFTVGDAHAAAEIVRVLVDGVR